MHMAGKEVSISKTLRTEMPLRAPCYSRQFKFGDQALVNSSPEDFIDRHLEPDVKELSAEILGDANRAGARGLIITCPQLPSGLNWSYRGDSENVALRLTRGYSITYNRFLTNVDLLVRSDS